MALVLFNIAKLQMLITQKQTVDNKISLHSRSLKKHIFWSNKIQKFWISSDTMSVRYLHMFSPRNHWFSKTKMGTLRHQFQNIKIHRFQTNKIEKGNLRKAQTRLISIIETNIITNRPFPIDFEETFAKERLFLHVKFTKLYHNIFGTQHL